MRLIDADALDAAFTDLRFSADGTLAHWGDRPDWCLHGGEVEKLIENAPTIGGWISVKDRLPEKSGNVLVCVKLDYAAGARYVQMCHYSAYKKQFGCFDTLENSGFPKFGVVTHWMPLPEPPMEGDA